MLLAMECIGTFRACSRCLPRPLAGACCDVDGQFPMIAAQAKSSTLVSKARGHFLTHMSDSYHCAGPRGVRWQRQAVPVRVRQLHQLPGPLCPVQPQEVAEAGRRQAGRRRPHQVGVVFGSLEAILPIHAVLANRLQTCCVSMFAPVGMLSEALPLRFTHALLTTWQSLRSYAASISMLALVSLAHVSRAHTIAILFHDCSAETTTEKKDL